MAWSAQGDPIHAEVSSANAQGTAIAFLLYNQGVCATARTLAANERVIITDILLVLAVGGAFTLAFAAADAGGYRILKGTLDAKSGVIHHFETPMVGPPGVLPYLIAAAGQVDCILTGSIVEA
jgi:hypothetical protein